MDKPKQDRPSSTGNGAAPDTSPINGLQIELERDLFLRNLIRHLAGTLQKVVGLEEASGLISVVGQQMGTEINGMYKKALGVDKLTREQAAEVCVDLKKRIQGDFYIIDQNTDRILLGNRQCPFADKVLGRPALCMMTSNVLGNIVADSAGYSKVVLKETIAEGHAGCLVEIHLKPTKEAMAEKGREYFAG